MNRVVEAELKGLLAYFGEARVSESEGTKPEDFFSLIVSFSTSLRVRTSYIKSKGDTHSISYLRKLL